MKNNTVVGNKSINIINNYINNFTNNTNKILIINDENNKENNTNYFKKQIRRINKVKIPLIKNGNIKTANILKKSSSLPLIYDKQILKHKMPNFYTIEKKRIINKIKSLDKTRNKQNRYKYKYLTEKIAEYKVFPKFKKTMKIKYDLKNRIFFFKK